MGKKKQKCVSKQSPNRKTTGQLFLLFSFLPSPADTQNDRKAQLFERQWQDGRREGRKGNKMEVRDTQNRGVPWRCTVFRAWQPGAEFLTLK